MREYKAGNVVEKICFRVGSNTIARSKRKSGGTSERKQEVNENSAARKLGRLINANYKAGDYFITLKHFEDVNLETGKKRADLFLRNMTRKMKKLELPFKWVLASSDLDPDTGEMVRVHTHLVINAESLETLREKWQFGEIDVQILKNQDDFTAIAIYMLKQVRREKSDIKKFSRSRNLIAPVPREHWVSDSYEPTVPRGAVVVERSEYFEGMSVKYVRYILPSAKESGASE